MVNYSKGSHFTYTYGGELFDHRIMDDQKCRVTLSKPVYGLGLKDACIRAAQEIYEENGEISLCVSNGVDSMSMLEAFVLAKVPFQVYTLEMNEGLNEQDIHLIKQTCKNLSIPLNLIKMDVLDFFLSGKSNQWSEQLHAACPQYNMLYEFFDKIPGCVLNGGQIPVVLGKLYNAARFYEDSQDGFVHHDQGITNHPHLQAYKRESLSARSLPIFAISNDNLDFGMMRYLKHRGRRGIPQFFFWSPEQIGGALGMPTYAKLAQGLLSWNYETKLAIYKNAGFSYPANKTKQHGSEKLFKVFIERYRKDLSMEYRYPYRWKYTGSHCKNLYSYKRYLSQGLI